MKHTQLVAKSIGVKSIACEDLKPNPHNPRMLFDRADMVILEASIKRVGILVPLTVYREERTGDYVILDGQRRWICAKALNLKKVPANEVAEPTLEQNIITMFQIHKLRKDWELMPTALKLELLIRRLKENRPRQLAELTGLEEAVVVRCKKLLRYVEKYRDMMLDPVPERRVKADFFIELYAVRNDREVNKFDWFDQDIFTDQMLEKFNAKGIKAVTDFRLIKQHITNAAKAAKSKLISRRLQEFANDPGLTPEYLNIESATVSADARKLLGVVQKLYTRIREMDIADYYGEDEMWRELDKLARLIRQKLKRLGRRGQE